MLERLWQAFSHMAKSFFETGLGALLLSMPFWHRVITGMTQGFQFIAAATGALIGLHGVYRIVRSYRNRPAAIGEEVK